MYLTPAQVAERWQCSASHVRRLARERRLRGMRLGSDWRFSEADVTAYELAQTTAPEPSTKPACELVGTGGSRVYTTVDLPADYEPVFPDLWPDHRPTKKSALSG